MRVAIDFLAAVDGGALTYLLNFPESLAKIDQDNRYYLVGGPEHEAALTNLGPRFVFVRAPVVGRSVYRRTLWQQFGLPTLLRRLGVDVLYSTINTTSLLAPSRVVLACRGHQVFTVPDMFPKTPASRMHLALRRVLMWLSARKAAHIITVSRTTREELIHILGVPESKISVVYHGISSIFRPILPGLDQRASWTRSYGLRGPYILSVSTLYRFKNYLNLIRAFHILKDKYAVARQLVIIGATPQPDYVAEIQSLITELNLTGEVVLIPGVPHHELPTWYSAADLYAFPSLCETFGLTQLEAMACGVPVSASRTSVIQEIGGEAALYFNPRDPDDIAQIMFQGLTDSGLRARLVQMGLRRAKQFSWENTARETLQVLQNFSQPAKLGCNRQESA